MSVAVGQLGAVHLRRIYLWEFNLALRRNAYQLHSSSQCKLLQA